MSSETNSEVVQSLPDLTKGIWQDLCKFMKFDYDDNPEAVLELIEMFAIDVITHLSRKVETVRPGYSDKLFAFINEATQEDSSLKENIEKPIKADCLEKSISGIVSGDLDAAVTFLTKKIKNEIDAGFEELPIASRNEVTLLCSLGNIVAWMYSEYKHEDPNGFVDKFSDMVRIFVADNQDNSKGMKKL
jgi:hypothetical protein